MLSYNESLRTNRRCSRATRAAWNEQGVCVPIGSSERKAGTVQGIALLAASVLPTLAIVSLVPNLPQLFAQFSAVPHHELLVPMIITLPSLCIAVFSPLAGMAADFWGRRRLLILALLAYSSLGLIPLLLNDIHFILGSRFVVGIAEAGILTAVNAMLGDYFAGEERKKWLGIQTTIGPVVASGLVLAGGKLGSIDWHAPFALYAIGLGVLVLVFVGTWEPKPSNVDRETLDSETTPFPWTATAAMGAVSIGLAIVYFVQAVQLGRMFGDLGVRSPQTIGIMVTVASVGVVLGGLLYRRISRRPISQMFAIIFLAFGIGYLGVALSNDYRVGLGFAVIAQLANGLTLPTLITWALGKYNYINRGRGMGVWGSCFFVGTFLSPLVVSGIGTWAGTFLRSVAVLGGFCLAISAFLWLVAPSKSGTADSLSS
jgi:MFS family permease